MEIEGQRTVGGDHRGDGARAPEIAEHGVVGVRSVENAKIIATAFRDIRARDGDRNAGGLGIENQRVVAACTVVARGTAVVVNRQGASRQRVRTGSSHIVSARGDGDRTDPKALLAAAVCLHVEIVGDGRKPSEREGIGIRRFQRPGRGTLDVAGRAILDVPRGGRAVLRPPQLNNVTDVEVVATKERLVGFAQDVAPATITLSIWRSLSPLDTVDSP